MQPRSLGKTGFDVSPIGYGAFKIGRNQKVKYPQPYDLPDESTVEQLLNEFLDMGITYIDTAPAYGLSEERIGNAIAHRRNEFTLSTKIGETFENGESTYDFSAKGIRHSIERSLGRLKTDVLDLVFIHSDGNDFQILNETDAVATLSELKQQGLIKAIGLSGKMPEAAKQAMAWADVLMVEYHLEDSSHEEVIAEAAGRGIGVIIKKGLAAGHLPADKAIRFVLGNPGVSSVIVGGLNPEHMRANVGAADGVQLRSVA